MLDNLKPVVYNVETKHALRSYMEEDAPNMIKKLWKRLLTHEFLVYLFFGVLTTVVNYVVYIGMLYILGDGSALIANAIAFVAAVVFAYVTNKPFVFASKSWKWDVVARELVTFFGSRLATFAMEELGLFICQDVAHMGDMTVLGLNGMIAAKVVLSIVVALLNYVLSKFLVFKKNPAAPEG